MAGTGEQGKSDAVLVKQQQPTVKRCVRRGGPAPAAVTGLRNVRIHTQSLPRIAAARFSARVRQK
jgi:hypothetical protein